MPPGNKKEHVVQSRRQLGLNPEFSFNISTGPEKAAKAARRRAIMSGTGSNAEPMSGTSSSGNATPIATPIPAAQLAQIQQALQADFQNRLQRELDKRERQHKKDLEDLKNDTRVFVEQQTQAAREAMAQPSAERIRTADLLWQSTEEVMSSRRRFLLNRGFTEEQAERLIQEPVTGSSATMVVNQPSRRTEWKAKEIGLFDGQSENLDKWIARVQGFYNQRIDPGWREPLLEALPKCMTGYADGWLNQQSPAFRMEHLSTMDGWIRTLRSVFGGDLAKKLADAQQRKWEFIYEPTGGYFLEKTRAMGAVYQDRSIDSFLMDVWLGLPDDFKPMIRKHMDKPPRATEMLNELQMYEHCWRAQDPVNRALRPRPSSTDVVVSTPSTKTKTKVEVSVSPPAAKEHISPVARQKESLKASFNPANLFTEGGKLKYRRPDGLVITRDRPCSICGGQHFDFAHDHTVGIKKEANFADLFYGGYPIDQCTYGGYPVEAGSPITVSDSSSVTTRLSSSPERQVHAATSPGASPSTAINVEESLLN